MTKTWFSGFASLLVLGSLTTALSVPAQAKMDSAGEVAPWVAHAEKTGAVEDSKQIQISVYLGFRNEDALDKLIKAQSTPGSAEFGHYLTRAQFHERFAPDKNAVAAVRTALERQGLKIRHVAASGLYIQAAGTVGQIKQAFKVDQNYYRYKGQTLRASSRAPALPAAMAAYVTHVGGLQDIGAMIHPDHKGVDRMTTPHAAVKSTAKTIQPPTADFLDSPICSSYWGDHTAKVSPTPAPFAATMPYLNCGYTPTQMQEAYGATLVSNKGAGITVAIVDAYASPTIVADANRYSAAHGLPKLTASNFSQTIPDAIFNVSPDEPCGPQGWFTEETLDVESVHTFAPGATIMYVGARNCDAPLFDAVYDTVDSVSPPNIITNSWSENGEFSSPNEQAVNNAEFRQAVVEGISILFSSGDDGDLDQINGVASGAWPSNSPWVTAVGGTTLALKAPNGTKQEWGWGTYRAFLGGTVTFSDGGQTVKATAALGDFSFYSGAGGGVSFYQEQPDYQKGVVPNAISTVTYSSSGEPIYFNTPRRVIPDVAMDADPYSGFLMGETFTISSTAVNNLGCTKTGPGLEYCEFGEGGTSLASPSFAGVLAVVDSTRASKGKIPLGFANPHLYKLKTGAPGTSGAPLIDIRAPATATSLLRAYPTSITENPRVITVNSVPNSGCPNGLCEGVDDVFNQTTPGYDNVTGLGTPSIPQLVFALGGG
jgi:subtilase family serine protease